jgi:phytoene synthase
MRRSRKLTVPEYRLEATYAECRAYTKYHAKSFYFSSFMLPRDKRMAAYAVYAFCRYADELVDSEHASTPREQLDAVTYARELLDRAYDPHFADSGRSALRDAIIRFDIPKEHFSALLDGVEMDITLQRYGSFEQLDLYCYRVASTVGLIMTSIFGYSSPSALPHAVSLGKAMQLTNILRDVREDFDNGRVYLPSSELRRFAYEESDIAHHVRDERFFRMMRFQVERAWEYYHDAELGLTYLPDDGSRACVAMMLRTYSGILEQIEEHNYDVYSVRHYVSGRRKLAMLLRYMIGGSGEYALKPRERRPSLPGFGADKQTVFN